MSRISKLILILSFGINTAFAQTNIITNGNQAEKIKINLSMYKALERNRVSMVFHENRFTNSNSFLLKHTFNNTELRFYSLSEYLSNFDKNDFSSLTDGIGKNEFKENNFSVNSNEKVQNSFFKSGLFYFTVTAVVVVAAYLLWPNKKSVTNTSTTFGLPLAPH